MANISSIGQNTTVNMLRLFKRRLVEPAELKAILSHVSDEERCLGSLPVDWFGTKRTSEERKLLTKNIFNIFSDFAKDTYSSSYVSPEKFEPFVLKFCSSLQDILDKAVTMSYLDKGLFGKVFRLNAGDKDYALKVFHSGVTNQKHGKTKEIANAINYCHDRKRRSRADFYFGKIAGEKDEDGFMVTEFIQRDPKEFLMRMHPLYQYRRYCVVDEGGFNNIKNRLIDFGDIFRYYPDKKTEKMAKRLTNAVASGDFKTVIEMKKEYGSNSVFGNIIADILGEYSIFKDVPRLLKQKHSPKQLEILSFLERYYNQTFAKNV